MNDTRRKLFGLFRGLTKTEEAPKSQNRDRTRKHRRDRSAKVKKEQGHNTQPPPSRGETVTSVPESAKSREERLASDDPIPLPPPLTEWPPARLKSSKNLSRETANELITLGAPIFTGTKRPIPHASAEYYNLYAACKGNADAGRDCAAAYTAAYEVDSMSLYDSRSASHPWETLDQPSMAFCYGTRAGEMTLNHWVSMSRSVNPAIALRDPGVRPREVELSTVLNRLIHLEGGFEADYEDLMYKNLYGTLLRDPDKGSRLRPYRGVEKQIADLILVLSGPGWIDFSLAQNQVVGKFFARASHDEQGEHKLFFHQLLLGMELFLRLQSHRLADHETEKLIAQLPPSIAWDLAVARRWRECMRIEKFTAEDKGKKIRFHLRQKKPQVKALRRFARAMKWPNLVKVDEVLKERDALAPALEDKSSDAMSYFSAMILPGVTMPWLIMNSLIDCDVDAGVNALAALTHMHPNSGFQYRSTTYWSSTSIVGKVLAPTCRSIGGWIGPARPAPDLGRIQIARIRQRDPKNRLSADDVLSMSERSDPLGPPADSYPVAEYDLLLPEIDPDNLPDTIRIEKLALKAVHVSTLTLEEELLLQQQQQQGDKHRPLLYDAAVQFAVAGESWPLRLSYDVPFISACPCARGPHPLFFDYAHQTVKIEDLLTIRHWGSRKGKFLSSNTSSASVLLSSLASTPNKNAGQASHEDHDDYDDEKVLVIEAFGVPDNEVLARAWCAHWALGAVVADMERTCLSCAVREAYAACLNVVILIEALEEDEGGD